METVVKLLLLVNNVTFTDILIVLNLVHFVRWLYYKVHCISDFRVVDEENMIIKIKKMKLIYLLL